MSGWIWAVVILLGLDAIGRPFAVGRVRTAPEMHASVIVDVAALLCLLKGGGVL